MKREPRRGGGELGAVLVRSIVVGAVSGLACVVILRLLGVDVDAAVIGGAVGGAVGATAAGRSQNEGSGEASDSDVGSRS